MADSATQIPRVGVAVVVYDTRGYVLLGKRCGSHGAGTLALPGGHLEVHEGFAECAVREVGEETGVRLRGVRLVTVVNSVHMKEEDGEEGEGKHYVTIFMAAHGEARQDGVVHAELMEPDKCLGWVWVPPSYLLHAAHSQLALDRVHRTAAQSGTALPVSVSRLVEAERVAEGLRGADADAVSLSSASRHVPTSRRSKGPKDDEERVAWDLADDLGMGAMLFRPLVSFIAQGGLGVDERGVDEQGVNEQGVNVL